MQRLVLASENRALQAMQAFDGDVMLIESERDAIIPRAVLTSYREAATHARSLTYRCLDGADHGLTEERVQRNYSKVLGTWLKEMVQGSRRAPAARLSAARILVFQQPVLLQPIVQLFGDPADLILTETHQFLLDQLKG